MGGGGGGVGGGGGDGGKIAVGIDLHIIDKRYLCIFENTHSSYLISFFTPLVCTF